MSDLVALKNVTIFWANLEKVNDMSGKYQVDIGNLSDEQVASLAKIKVIAKVHDLKGRFITCKSSRPIKALDGKGNPLTGAKIGNGTSANALIGSYEWKAPVGGKKGVSPSLAKLVITNLVEYNPDATVSDDEDFI
jgi:hypothetical protein